MAPQRWEVQDVIRLHGDAYRQVHGPSISTDQLRVMQAVETCRTAALGGHVEACEACGVLRISYNSCCNRHCPKCQSLAKEKWLEARRAELLPVEYFHVVFTVPEKIAAISLQNKRVIYNILFRATAMTLRTIAADPKHLGAEIGFLAVLHTWSQNLRAHPHLHCIVPGGGFHPEEQRWVSCRPGFFLPVRVLSRLFRRLFLEALDRAYEKGELDLHGSIADLQAPERFRQWLASLRQTEWVVYAKRPFGGPEKVLDYLGRYTHRVAISNHRILDVADGKVTFSWRDYRHGNRKRPMTLDAEKFIRRFLLHALPTGFVRIRHFGFLANRYRAEKLERARELLHVEPPELTDTTETWEQRCQRLTGRDPTICPECGEGRLVVVETLPKPESTSVEGIDSS